MARWRWIIHERAPTAQVWGWKTSPSSRPQHFPHFFIHPGRKKKNTKKFAIGERELQITFLKAASKRARVSSKQSRIFASQWWTKRRLRLPPPRELPVPGKSWQRKILMKIFNQFSWNTQLAHTLFECCEWEKDKIALTKAAAPFFSFYSACCINKSLLPAAQRVWHNIFLTTFSSLS